MNGEHGTRTNSKCVKMFYVLSGQIRTTTDGKQYVAQAGDLICIPKGVTAHIEGDDAEALIICGPAFDSAFDV
ncbi:MAG: cupin domain-containing protein [Henriciella sp.]